MSPKDGLWTLPTAGGFERVGLEAAALENFGEPVYLVFLAPPGELAAGKPFALVESAKAVRELALPFPFTINACNHSLEDNTARIAREPRDSWLIEGRRSGVSSTP